VIVPAHPQVAAKAPAVPPQTADVTSAVQNGQAAAAAPPSQPAAAANTMTVTIIDGETGAKEEVTVPSRSATATASAAGGSTASTVSGLYQKLVGSRVVRQRSETNVVICYLWSGDVGP
jgi:hypothetical protein